MLFFFALMYLTTANIKLYTGNLSERLRRKIRNLLGFARAGSSPAVVDIFLRPDHPVNDFGKFFFIPFFIHIHLSAE